MPWPTLIERAGQTRTAGGIDLTNLLQRGVFKLKQPQVQRTSLGTSPEVLLKLRTSFAAACRSVATS